MYVEQEDQHLPELTVRETFDFSACTQGAGSNAGGLSRTAHSLHAWSLQLAATWLARTAMSSMQQAWLMSRCVHLFCPALQ